MNIKKIIFFLVIFIIIGAFAVVFINNLNKKNVPDNPTVSLPADSGKQKTDKEKEDNDATAKDENTVSKITLESQGAVATSGEILSVAEESVKVKDKDGKELDLKFAPFTKFYEMKPPTPPTLKDKSVLREGAFILFEYDKGTLALNSIMVQ